MADRQSTLAIVIQAVDKATAVFRKMNTAITVLTAPISLVGEKLSGLWTEGGGPALVEGFKSVGTAVGDLFKKLAIGAGIVALAAHGALGLVDEFDKLGDTAEKLGTTVDFLAAMRFAAERSGASVEELDQGLTAFAENMGQLRAGTGRMLKFLMQVSPALVTQLKATKGNEAAFRLMADAMSKVTDQQKRLALGAKTGLGSALVPMLARGSAGLMELQGEFAGTAGSLEEAASKAGETDDALKNLKAAAMGAKAALITGLAPALTIIVDKLSQWFTAHREDIAAWAAQIGEKLPAAVDKVVDAIKSAVEWVGGWKNVAIGAAAVIAGPFVASLATLVGAFGKLAIVLAANPIALIATAVAALTLGVVELVKHWEDVKSAIVAAAEAVADFLGLSGDGSSFVDTMIGTQGPSVSDVANRTLLNLTAARSATEARIMVQFSNAPHGTRVTADPRNTADVDLTVGHQLLGAN